MALGKYDHKGKQAEIRFLQLVDNSKPATLYQDRTEHIDHYVKNNGEKYSVDVKAIRGHGHQWHCAETISRIGKQGSLYSKADKIAFECKNSFLLIPTSSFQAFYVDKIEPLRHEYKNYPKNGSVQKIGKSEIVWFEVANLVPMSEIMFKNNKKRQKVFMRIGETNKCELVDVS